MPQQPQSFGGQSNPYAQSSAKNSSQQPQYFGGQMQPSQTANPFTETSGQNTPQPYPNPYAPQQSQSQQIPDWLTQLFNNYGQQQSQQQQYSNPYAQQSQQPQQSQSQQSPDWMSQLFNNYGQQQQYSNPYQTQNQSQQALQQAQPQQAPQQMQAATQEQPNAFTPNYPTDDYSQPHPQPQPQPQTQSGLGALQQYYGFSIDPYMPPPPPPPTQVAPPPPSPTQPAAAAPPRRTFKGGLYPGSEYMNDFPAGTGGTTNATVGNRTIPTGQMLPGAGASYGNTTTQADIDKLISTGLIDTSFGLTAAQRDAKQQLDSYYAGAIGPGANSAMAIFRAGFNPDHTYSEVSTPVPSKDAQNVMVALSKVFQDPNSPHYADTAYATEIANKYRSGQIDPNSQTYERLSNVYGTGLNRGGLASIRRK
jgi:hypothetical protein